MDTKLKKINTKELMGNPYKYQVGRDERFDYFWFKGYLFCRSRVLDILSKQPKLPAYHPIANFYAKVIERADDELKIQMTTSSDENLEFSVPHEKFEKAHWVLRNYQDAQIMYWTRLKSAIAAMFDCNSM